MVTEMKFLYPVSKSLQFYKRVIMCRFILHLVKNLSVIKENYRIYKKEMEYYGKMFIGLMCLGVLDDFPGLKP